METIHKKVLGSSTVWTDLGLFAVTLGLAYAFEWEAADLVWGLWVSSLSIGYLTLILGPILFPIIRGQIPWAEIGKSKPLSLLAEGIKSASPVALLLGLFVLLLFGGFFVAFFTVHFGMFHFVHGAFLSGFFPLSDLKYPNDPWKLPSFAVDLLRSYWPFVATSALSGWNRVRSAPEGPKGGAMQGALVGPYKSVIRMHCLIFVFAAMKFFKAGNFAFYSVILFAYFFPWRILWRTKGAVEPAKILSR